MFFKVPLINLVIIDCPVWPEFQNVANVLFLALYKIIPCLLHSGSIIVLQYFMSLFPLDHLLGAVWIALTSFANVLYFSRIRVANFTKILKLKNNSKTLIGKLSALTKVLWTNLIYAYFHFVFLTNECCMEGHPQYLRIAHGLSLSKRYQTAAAQCDSSLTLINILVHIRVLWVMIHVLPMLFHVF